MAPLGERLKSERIRKGLTQQYVAGSVGINRVSLAQIESGRRRVTADELRSFCGLYGVSADDLLFGKRQQNKDVFFEGLWLLDGKDRGEVVDVVNYLVRRKIEARNSAVLQKRKEK